VSTCPELASLLPRRIDWLGPRPLSIQLFGTRCTTGSSFPTRVERPHPTLAVRVLACLDGRL